MFDFDELIIIIIFERSNRDLMGGEINKLHFEEANTFALKKFVKFGLYSFQGDASDLSEKERAREMKNRNPMGIQQMKTREIPFSIS